MASNSSNEFQVYIDQCIHLASTLIVKSEDSANGLNQYVKDYYGVGAVNEAEPATWKYYLNISGQYHPADTMMSVQSLDTMQPIDFTAANLQLHRATAAAYRYGTREYQALVAQYPAQVFLILGIIYPVDIRTAIDARDGQILGWPASFIEPNEASLIEKLQHWIDGFKSRWVNPQYPISDPLYPAVQLANLYCGLLMAIVNFRLEACGTAEAHSFHVQQYLASHLGLDRYLFQLTLEQSLWLYRNINYIERNVGKASTFSTLIEHILTSRNIPLAAYVMQHNVAGMPNALYPAIEFVAEPLNFGMNLEPNPTWTLDTMLDNEQPLATMNAAIQPDVEPGIRVRMENALSNRLQTKVLNSAMIDSSDSTPYTLENILVNHWLYFSSLDLYTAFLLVDNPVTGEAIVPMNAKDGYTFMWYCFSMSIGLDLTRQAVPALRATRVQRIPMPDIADLMAVVDTRLVPQDIASLALSWQPVIAPMISIDAFCNTARSIWQATNTQRNLVAAQEHAIRRGMVYGMVERIYSDNVVQLGDYAGQTYGEWFALRNLDITSFATADYGLMYRSLVQAATGLNLDSSSTLANLQQAMIAIMQKLSSYSVQYLSEINTTPITDVDWPMVRVGDVDGSGAMILYEGDTTADVIAEANTGMIGLAYDVNPATADHLFDACVIDARDAIAVDVTPAHDPIVINRFVPVPGLSITPVMPLQPNALGIAPVIGLDAWLALSDAQRIESMVSLASPNYNTASTPLPQMATVWPNRNLSGLIYTPPQ